MKENKPYKYKFLLLTLIVTTVVTGLVCYWQYKIITGNAWDELMLIQHHETCSGFLVDASWETDYYSVYSRVTYTYSIPDGRQFTQEISGHDTEKYQSWDLPYPIPIEVEYLPDNPSVSRIKGDGPYSSESWLWHELVGHGLFINWILIAIGIYLLYREVKELKRLKKHKKSVDYPTNPWRLGRFF